MEVFLEFATCGPSVSFSAKAKHYSWALQRTESSLSSKQRFNAYYNAASDVHIELGLICLSNIWLMFVFDNSVSDISPVLGLALFMDGIIEYFQDSKII